jgi:tetratricopeptide (TPR) repeat protein
MAKNVSPTEYIDPALGPYEQGLKAYFSGKFDKGAKLFSQVVEAAEQSDLAARARTFATACQQRLDDPAQIEDPFLEAVIAKNRGDFSSAMELCTRGGRKGKDERFSYLAASLESLQGNEEEALSQLNHAIDLNAENRIFAYHDPDFEALREHREFRSLILGEDTDAEPPADA